jgi:hypothetical protein
VTVYGVQSTVIVPLRVGRVTIVCVRLYSYSCSTDYAKGKGRFYPITSRHGTLNEAGRKDTYGLR